MMLTPNNYERVTQDAIYFAQSASTSGWLFSEYIRAAREAWIIQHEDMLSHAKYQVEQDIKRPEVK